MVRSLAPNLPATGYRLQAAGATGYGLQARGRSQAGGLTTPVVGSPQSVARSEAGFSLIEVLVATLVVTIGLVSMAQLLAVATLMHAGAREATTATQQARAKVDELMKLNMSTNAAVQITPASPDSLTTNVTNYFDAPATGITRRWRVQAGPAANTRILTVRVVNTRARQYGATIDLTTIIRQW